MKINLFFTALFLVLFQKGISQNKASDVQSFTLSNGMKILVVEDNSIPIGSLYLFWTVGTSNEFGGCRVWCHEVEIRR